jgi:probable HAF family extracellular repeat protein
MIVVLALAAGVALVALFASLSLGPTKTSAYAATGEDQLVSQGLSIKDLGTLSSGGNSWGNEINELGQVAGYSYTASGTEHAFLWQNGRMRDLGTLGTRVGAYSYANDLNDHGQVVGYSETASGAYHAFLWQNGKMRNLGALGGHSSMAEEINEHGQVVGGSYTASGREHAVLWSK